MEKLDRDSNDDNFKLYSDYLMYLALLKQMVDLGNKIGDEMGRYMNNADRLEIITYTCKVDELYWKYFRKYIGKLRGF